MSRNDLRSGEYSSGHRRKKSNKRKRLVIVLIVLVVYFIGIIAAAVLIDDRHVRFYLTGGESVTAEAGGPWKDPGIRAVSAGRLFGEEKTPVHVDTSGVPDMSRPGDYTVRYSARLGFTTYTASRQVSIVDTTAPEITLNHIEGYEPDWISGYTEEGYTAIDSVDGDVTDKVVRTEYKDRVVYTVSDSCGNTATAERKLEYKTVPPQITLLGEERMSIPASYSVFADPGFRADDGSGNDISGLVEVTGQVIPYVAGTYELRYVISGEAGEVASAVRTVDVYPVNRPETVDPDGKVIYLTFDDGPSCYTGRLLDVLAKYNVPVTFFVTGEDPNHADMIGRAYREGHSIGVHTYSHDYNYIYSSEDAFFEDFYRVQDLIYEQTGSYTNICRFPGGSSNTISRFNPGIISRLAEALTDMGYAYFDWNVSSGDAGETTDTRKVVENVIDGCSNFRISVVLQHDIKDFSVAAVEDIIIWGLNNGYTFRGLDASSPTAHHGINN